MVFASLTELRARKRFEKNRFGNQFFPCDRKRTEFEHGGKND